MKNYSKNKIIIAKPKSKYLVNLLFFGQQYFQPWHTTTSPNPPIVRRRTFSPFQHSSLTRAKIWCQHMPPNFGVKYPLFTLKLIFVMITLWNGLFRVGGELFALNLSPSRPHNGNLPIHLPSFYPHTPKLNPGVKNCTGARNRFTFPLQGYKLPYRHCSFSIGQSFLCLLLPQTLPKTPAFLSPSE